MKEVTVYSTKMCPFCMKAKHLLKLRSVPFTEHVYTFGTPEMDALVKQTNHMTVPQIFIGDEFIGGCDELELLIRKGELDVSWRDNNPLIFSRCMSGKI